MMRTTMSFSRILTRPSRILKFVVLVPCFTAFFSASLFALPTESNVWKAASETMGTRGSGNAGDVFYLFLIFGILVALVYAGYHAYVKYWLPNSEGFLFRDDDIYRTLLAAHQVNFWEKRALVTLCREKQISMPSILFLRPQLLRGYLEEAVAQKNPNFPHLKTLRDKIHGGKYPTPVAAPQKGSKKKRAS